jgi:hypothetical protein
MNVRRLLVIFSLFLLLYGCTGTEGKSPFGFKTVDECDTLHTRDSARMQCYHTAAITSAYLCDESGARNICSSIWLQFSGAPDSGNDIRRKAELVHNKCYYDIAKITKNPALCGSIEKKDNLGISLLGEEVTRDMCYQEVESLASIAPDNLYQNNPNSMCSAVFILPLLLIFTRTWRP